MSETGTTRIKICGLVRRSDAVGAVEAGADYLGVVLVPGTPRARSPEEALEVVSGLSVPVVAVVAGMAPGRVAMMAETVGASVVQLHGDESPEQAAAVGQAGPWSVWKALRVRDPRTVLRALEVFRGKVDGVVLDGWHPSAGEGTGTVFDWSQVESQRGRFPPGLIFAAAGGLTPENVGEAVRRLQHHVVDVSSGVEEKPGVKSHERMVAFVRAARGQTG
jgi:phosphoribosylanthranilate isomerase